MVTRYLQLLLAVADVVAIVFVLLSAWQMFTAAGDATKYATAKKSLLYALLGVVIIMSMLYFIQIIKNAAGTLGG